MRLTQRSDFGLRMLMYLALRKEEDATVADVAKTFGLSRNHLTKVAQDLRALGVVETQRGRGGGLRLAKPPEAIGLGEVVRALERFDIVECFAPETNHCLLTPSCGLQGVLGEAVDAFLEVLDRHSLADLLVHPRRMRALIDRPAS